MSMFHPRHDRGDRGERRGRRHVDVLGGVGFCAAVVLIGGGLGNNPLLGVGEAHAGSPYAQFSKPTTFAQNWKHYKTLPDLRAIAIAGDIRTHRWVSGIVAGARTREAAAAQAIKECRRQRHAARMRAPCLLFAEGDERVADRRDEE